MIDELNYRGERIPYEIIKSQRRTISVEIRSDSSVLVRIPQRMTKAETKTFVDGKAEWIVSHRQQMKERMEANPKIRLEDRREETLKLWNGEGGRQFLKRVSEWAGKMGVTYGRITIRDQKTRWGSCSSKGNLNFNWKLLAVPQELSDYVIVHELAHRLEMNHSPRFWAVVEQQLPDYKQLRQELKKYQ